MRKAQAEIYEWIHQQEVRLGISSDGVDSPNSVNVPTVTVYLGPLVIERLAHFGADAKIAVDPRYAAMCERLDAELAEILSDGSARAPSLPNILTNY
jgi:hypothetical protein